MHPYSITLYWHRAETRRILASKGRNPNKTVSPQKASHVLHLISKDLKGKFLKHKNSKWGKIDSPNTTQLWINTKGTSRQTASTFKPLMLSWFSWKKSPLAKSQSNGNWIASDWKSKPAKSCYFPTRRKESLSKWTRISSKRFIQPKNFDWNSINGK